MSGTRATERSVDGTPLVLTWDQDSGEPVLLERTPPVDPVEESALREAATRFAHVRSPHLSCPRAVVCDAEQTVVVLDAAAVRSLSSLAARRTSLEPGEVVTVGVALARALTAVHSEDLLLGELASSQVLLRDDGMPVVVVGASALRASVGTSDLDAGRARDVGALVELCRSLLGSTPPVGLVEVLQAGAASDLTQRPDAVVLGAQLARACRPAPVRWTVEPDPVPVPPGRHAERGSTSWGPRLPAGALLVLAALVVAAAVVGWTWGRGGEAPTAAPVRTPASQVVPASAGPTPDPTALAAPATVPTQAATTEPAPTSTAEPTPAATTKSTHASGALPTPAVASPRGWSVVLDQLDAARAAAFAAADEDALRSVYAPSAPGLAEERARVRALAADGRTAHGVRHSVRDVEVLTAAPDRVRLRVTDVLGAYEVRAASGAVVGTAPGRGEAVSIVDLRRTSAGWRVADLVRSS